MRERTIDSVGFAVMAGTPFMRDLASLQDQLSSLQPYLRT